MQNLRVLFGTAHGSDGGDDNTWQWDSSYPGAVG
jgi:hypothetical protein